MNNFSCRSFFPCIAQYTHSQVIKQINYQILVVQQPLKEKEQREGEDPIEICVVACCLVFFSCPFFCLIKRTKNQACRIASGRHSALRAWVLTFLVACNFEKLYNSYFRYYIKTKIARFIILVFGQKLK